MRKLFEKSEIWFAVMWIIIYVVGFSTADSISESIGIPKLVTAIISLVMSAVLFFFVKKNDLMAYFGLCRAEGRSRKYLYFLPILLISSVNFWNGITCKASLPEVILFIISMLCVGFLEELIFRGFLFKAMCRDNVKTAIVVSSLTFGFGHIVNLLRGEALLETLMQLIYASAIGFCFTVLFYVSKSIIPCIIAHAVVNSTSMFCMDGNWTMFLISTAVITVTGAAYGVYLLRSVKKDESNPA
ncbi:MAG: CPBP family intramembrane metalloprotease [Oscillospiraceae bacterium]|nr:CPBP family intramembrane metalloprotease [Oscillospiraceae bacterium]